MRERGSWVFLVLTYPFKSKRYNWQLFEQAKTHWDRLRKRLVHRFDDLAYVQTWEVTKKGVPHVNVAISSQKLYTLVCDAGCWVADSRRPLGMRFQWYDLATSWKVTWLEPAQVECGFGPTSTLEPCCDEERMSNYLCKLARELTGSGKKSQVPVNAPLHFRRIRASRGLLPPRFKNEDITGTLEYSAHPEVSRLHHEELARRAIDPRYRSRIDYSSGVAMIIQDD